MTTQYPPEKQLIRDFIHYISDNHKCAVVHFPEEFAAHQYINYKFINVGNLIEEFMNDIQRQN